MRAGGGFVPFDQHARAVAAKDRIGRVFGVGVGLVACGGDDFLRIVAGRIARGRDLQAACAARVGRDLPRVAAQPGHRRAAGEHGQAALGLGGPAAARSRRTCAGYRSSHGPTASAGSSRRSAYHGSSSCTFPRAGGCAQALAHGAVGGLAEVAALGVLEVRAPGCQRDFDIGQRRAGQHARVGALGQVGQDQPLPAAVQRVGAAGPRPAARRCRAGRVPAAGALRHNGAAVHNGRNPPPRRSAFLYTKCRLRQTQPRCRNGPAIRAAKFPAALRPSAAGCPLRPAFPCQTTCSCGVFGFPACAARAGRRARRAPAGSRRR